jgi:hypothetical protein
MHSEDWPELGRLILANMTLPSISELNRPVDEYMRELLVLHFS